MKDPFVQTSHFSQLFWKTLKGEDQEQETLPSGLENIALRGQFSICLTSKLIRFSCCPGKFEVIQASLFLSSSLEDGGCITMNSELLRSPAILGTSRDCEEPCPAK